MRRLPLLVAALLLTGAAACGGDDDGGGPTDGLLSGGDPSIAAALAELPVPEGDELTISITDLDAAAEANSAGPRPDDPDELAGWLARVGGQIGDGDTPPPVFAPVLEVAGVRTGTPPAEVEDELGWSVADVARVAEVQSPPFRFTVVAGDVDEGTLEDADLEDLGDGVWSAGTGEDLETDPEGRTTARPTGVPLRMAATDGRLAASTSTDAVEAWLDGTAGSLADDDGLAAIAEALDDGGAVSALLAVSAFEPGPGPEGRPPAPITTPFRAVGVGWGTDGDEAVVTVAYAFEDEGAAGEAVEQVRSAWAEGGSVRTARLMTDLVAVDDVRADGSVVVVRLTVPDGSRSQVVADMLFERDRPFTRG